MIRSKKEDRMYEALMIAEDFMPEAIDILRDIIRNPKEDPAEKTRAIALMMRFVENGRDTLAGRNMIDLPIDKLTTRSIVSALIPDMSLIEEESECQTAQTSTQLNELKNP